MTTLTENVRKMKYSNDDISVPRNFGKKDTDDDFLAVLPRIIDPSLGLTHIHEPKQTDSKVGERGKQLSAEHSNQLTAKRKLSTDKTQLSESEKSSDADNGECNNHSKVSNIKYYIILFISILITGVLIYFIYKYFQRPNEKVSVRDMVTTDKPPELCFSKQKEEARDAKDPNTKSNILDNVSKYITVDGGGDDDDNCDQADQHHDANDNVDDNVNDLSDKSECRVEIVDDGSNDYNIDLDSIDVEHLMNTPMLESPLDTLLEEQSDTSSIDESECKIDVDILDTESVAESVNSNDGLDVFKRYANSDGK